MNKYFVSLLIVALISQALALSQLPSQNKLFSITPQMLLEKTHLGRALLNMVTLGSTNSYKYDDLFDALEGLKQSLHQAENDENDQFSQDQEHHDINVLSLENKIESLNDQIDTENSHLDKQLEDEVNEKKNLNSQQDQLQNALNLITHLHSQLENLEHNYNIDSLDYSEALDVLDQAIQKLKEAQVHFENSSLSSLLQLSSQYILLAQNVHRKIAKLPKDRLLMVKPALMILSQLSAETEQSAVQNAIQALEDVKVFLREGLVDLNQTYQRQEGSLQEQVKESKAIAENLRDNLIPGTEARLSLLQSEIKSTQDLIDTLNDDLELNQQNLDEENRIWGLRKNRHFMLILKYDEEIKIVQQAIDVLRRSYEKFEI